MSSIRTDTPCRLAPTIRPDHLLRETRLDQYTSRNDASMAGATDQLIDSFAYKLRQAGVPIRSEDNSARLMELEARLPKRLPQSFESLLSRYSFPSFEICGISFLGWESASSEFFEVASRRRARCLSYCSHRGTCGSVGLKPAISMPFASTLMLGSRTASIESYRPAMRPFSAIPG